MTSPPDQKTFQGSWVPQAKALRVAQGFGTGPTDAFIDWWRTFYGGWTLDQVLSVLRGNTPQSSGPTPGPASLPTPIALPSIPTRDQLGMTVYRFNGDVPVITKQLGTVPSWGPDLWMLNDPADRLVTMQSHRAAGATGICVTVKGIYQEAGVQYPNNIAQNNDFTNDLATLYSRLLEIIAFGLTPLLMLGGDNGFDYITANLPAQWNALKSGPNGDITPYIIPCSGFDSIDGIGLGQFHDNGATLDNLLVFIRSVIGPNAVQAKEITPGFPFWASGGLGSPGAQACDILLQEFASGRFGNEATPKIVSGVYDPEHSDYAAQFDKNADEWQQVWQDDSRLLANYKPLDQPFNVAVKVSGGPLDGTIQPVSSDSQGHNGSMTRIGTPRGRFFINGFEHCTWQRTHGACDDQYVRNMRAKLQATGFDAVS